MPSITMDASAFEKPTFEKLPDGSYVGELIAVTPVYPVANPDSDWRGIRFTVQLTADSEGNDTFGENESPLAGVNPVNYLVTLSGNPQAVKIGTEQFIKAAVALGLWSKDQGSFDVPDTVEEAVELLEPLVGTAVTGVYLKTKVQKRNGQVQTHDDGTPIRRQEVTSFFAV